MSKIDIAGMELPVDKPGRMIITHPGTGLPLKRSDGSEAYLDLYSLDSPRALAHQQALRKAALKRKGRPMSPEEVEAALLDQTVTLTDGWSLANLSGGDLDVQFTPDNARQIYENPRMAWLRKQAEAYFSEIGNFVTASATS